MRVHDIAVDEAKNDPAPISSYARGQVDGGRGTLTTWTTTTQVVDASVEASDMKRLTRPTLCQHTVYCSQLKYLSKNSENSAEINGGPPWPSPRPR